MNAPTYRIVKQKSAQSTGAHVIRHACRSYPLITIFALLLAACPDEPVGRYTCANGQTIDGTPDTDHIIEFCLTCDDGYVRSDSDYTCHQAIYTCAHGVATRGNPTRGTSDIEQCATCTDGYTLDENTATCRQIIYVCLNGIAPDENPDSGDSDIEQCDACINGYHQDGDTCAMNTYTCANGTKHPAGTPGAFDGDEYCATCVGGYGLNTIDNTCAIDSDGDGAPDVIDVDDDNNGLIDIRTLDMLHNIHYNLQGSSYDDEEADSDSGNGTGNGTGNDSGDAGDITGAPVDATDNCDTATTDGVYLCGYELIRSLDFTEPIDYADGIINTDWRPNDPDPDMATNEGWPGIGVDSATAFNTQFNGNGHTIANLYRRGSEYVGLFNSTGAASRLWNFGVVDVNLYGGDDADRIGALIGQSNGVLFAAYATGFIDGGENNDTVGGLVGEVGGSTVLASYATTAVDGGSGADVVGGLVGRNSGNVIASYATGSVDGGDDDDIVGGLIGAANESVIRACYATGDVDGGDGDDDIGGLAGANGSSTDGSSTIVVSYGFGAVTNGEEVFSEPGSENLGGTDVSALQITDDSIIATYAGLEWNRASDNTSNAWDFAEDDAPALRYADYDGGGGDEYACTDFSNITMDMCGATLLPGQRE